MRAIPGRRRFFLSSRIHGLDDDEDHERDDQKIYDVVDEGAVGDHRDSFRFSIGKRSGNPLRMVKNKEQTCEINLAQEQSYRWHDDSFDHGRDDLSEVRADDYGDGQIDYISAGKKFLEFF